MKDERFRVLKFGGSTLGKPERLRRAAEMVRSVEPTVRAVVASAPGNTTDQLWELVQPPASTRSSPEAVQAVGLGDLVGAAIMTAELVALGLRARLLVPGTPDWPVLTEGEGWETEVDLTGTSARLRSLEERFGDVIWVLPGYVGFNERSGRWTALGRGGSDVTAVAIGSCRSGSEVVLVKDVPGVLSGDPGRVRGATVLPELTVREMSWLAEGGASVVAAQALHYLGPGGRLRVVGLGAQLEAPGGTSIVPDPPGRSDPLPDRSRVRRAVEIARGAGWSSVVTLPSPSAEARRVALDTAPVGAPEAEGLPMAVVVPPEDLDRFIEQLQASGRVRALAVRAPSAPSPAGTASGGRP